MRKRILSLILLLLCIFMLFGCREDGSFSDTPIISNNTFKIGVLLSENEVTSQYIESGISFANSLASRVLLDNNIEVSYITDYYTDDNDVTTVTDKLINSGATALVYGGEDYNAFIEFTDYVSDKAYPVLSLSPFECDNHNVFSLSLSKEYMASCVATYAIENGYHTSAALFEYDDKYYSDFADTYVNTFKSYSGYEPTVYFINGEHSNYSSSVAAAGNYDCLFMVCSGAKRESITMELRATGFTGEIIFDEILNNSAIKSNIYNNCSFISKVYDDSSNNIATVFNSMYSQQYSVKPDEIEPAVAYGYDAYMIAFEALKSFGSSIGNSIFSNESTTEVSAVSASEEIKSSEYIKAISKLNYFGVTDTIAFVDNQSSPTYIFINNIVDSEILLGSKYSFTSNNISN